MPTFTYTAIDAGGQRTSGSLSAAGRSAAFRELERRSLTPLELEMGSAAEAGNSQASTRSDDESKPIPSKLKRSQIILFTEELADMLDAGLQLEAALKILQDRRDSPALTHVSAIAREEVRDGAKFADALKLASPSFDPLYLNMVASGEASGSLPQILRRLGRNLTISADLQSRVTAALIYPAFIMGLCAVLVVVFFVFLLPKLSQLIETTGQDLPFVTAMMIRSGELFRQWWWLLAVILVTGFLIFKAVISGERGRRWWDRAKLRIPLVGGILSWRFHAAFCHGLANLVNNGVPLVSGLRLMGNASTNSHLRHIIRTVTGQVAEGVPLSRALRHGGNFPPLMGDMVAVGEQTGDLGRALEKTAARYDKELDHRIAKMTALITPVLITVIAGIVLLVALSIVGAISSSVSGIRNRS